MKLIERNGMWYVEFTDSTGKRRRISTRTGDEREAKRRMAEVVKDTKADTLKQEATRQTLGWLLMECYDCVWSRQKSSTETYHRINGVRSQFGHVRLNEVNEGMLMQMKRQWLKDGNAPATVNRKFALILRALRYGMTMGFVARLPDLRELREDENNQKESYLSEQDEAALLAAYDTVIAEASEREAAEWTLWKLYTVFLLDTGARAGEARLLGWDRCPGPEGAPLVTFLGTSTKTSKTRTVPLTRRAQETLKAARALRPDAAGPFAGLEKDVMIRRFNKVRKLAGLAEDITVHSLRHTCASRLVQRGVDLYVVKDWLGHSVITTTQRYAKLRPDNLLSAVQVLEI